MRKLTNMSGLAKTTAVEKKKKSSALRTGRRKHPHTIQQRLCGGASESCGFADLNLNGFGKLKFGYVIHSKRCCDKVIYIHIYIIIYIYIALRDLFGFHQHFFFCIESLIGSFP